MLTVLVAICLGIVEGLTEFIPVSSTGHMILTAKLMGIDEQSDLLKTFEVVIQLGAILAIAVVYREKILRMLGLAPKTMRKGNAPKKQLNLLHLVLGMTPALLTAFIAKDYIKELFSAETVLLALIAGGLFMWFAEWKGNQRSSLSNTIDDITYKQAFIIGLYQIVSVLWPGFSRSGSTIAGGMLSRVSYRAAADFSFIMAIPIMLAASGYELLQNYKQFDWHAIGFFGLGFIVSFMVAYVVVVFFLKHIQSITLKHFAIYRFLLAALFWFFVML